MPLSLRKRNGVWHARGSLPERQEDGTIGRRRIEKSCGTGSKSRAIEIAEAYEREAFQRAYNPAPAPEATFMMAAATYIETTGVGRFIAPLVNEIGKLALSRIDQDEANRVAARLYPSTTAATRNRQVFTPLLAVLNLAARQGRCAKPCIERPRGHDEIKPLSIPDDDWFDRLLPHCTPKLAALIVFLTLTGRRITEVTNLDPRDYNERTGQVVIGRSKTGDPICVAMPDLAAIYLRTPYRAQWRRSRKLFGFADRRSVYRALMKACKAAKVEYIPPHRFGRHAFATRLLEQGRSLKHVKEAGGWATIKQPAMRYGHLEQSEVAADVKAIGHTWGKARIGIAPQRRKA